MNVYVLLALLHHLLTVVKFPLLVLLTVIFPVHKSIVTHAHASVHVSVIVAVASFFMYHVLQFHQLHTGAVSSFHTAYNVTVFPLIPVRLLTFCQSVYVADVAVDDVLHHLNVYHAFVYVLLLSVQLVPYVQVVLLILLHAHQFLSYAI